MPRAHIINFLSKKGDYLIRINDREEIILSILWTDSTDPNKLKDGHFVIHEKDNVRRKYVRFVIFSFCLSLDVFIPHRWSCTTNNS